MVFKVDGKIRLCRWCPNPVKKYYDKRNYFKSYLNTCGSEQCRMAAYKNKNINQLKRFHASRICESCKISYEATSFKQRWCKKCSTDRKHSTLLTRYNLSAPQVKVLLVNTNGMCKICLIRKATVVDHDHKTKNVRGIICPYCNMALHMIEQPEIVKRAMDYLEGKL